MRIQQKKLENPSQSLIDFYQASQLQDPNSSQSTYLEMVSSGQINLIRNDILKTKLIRHYEVEWGENDIFKMHNNYRENVRGKMPDRIQEEIRANCNDIYIKLRYSLESSLPKKCSVNIPLKEGQDAVSILRKDASLKKDLRFLIGNVHAKLHLLKSVSTELQLLINEIKAII